ncbi:YeiH family protein [Pseudonocardia nigra]|uniref:YeiH family protein n=1 Tax=Pseudonocardia nigra TaxID=1921578 RepID=UPI001FEB9699|nr:putative sulfate exporter family transporter [Pseudonocardia nigra]
MMRATVPGLAVATLLAVVATAIGTALPALGGPVAALALGALAGPLLKGACSAARWGPGLGVAAKHVLQAALVVLGFGLPFTDVVRVAGATLPVMLGTLLAALGGAAVLGPAMRLHPETTLLIGAGTAICGASAIAAVTSVLRPAQERVAYAIATIFACNMVAVLAYPVLGRLLGLSGTAFGLWAGTAINDTSSVVAAAGTFGTAAAAYAVVVKLSRSVMIVPLCVAVRVWRSAAGPTDGPRPGLLRAFPVFILGFLAASAVAATGVVPDGQQAAISAVSTFLISMSLAAIGATLDVGRIRAAGLRPLAFGGLLGLLVGATSLGLQALTGQL